MCLFAAGATAGALTATQALAINASLAATLATSIAAPVVSYFAQQSAANAQRQYQEQQYTANQQIAEQSLMSQYADISRRQQEERQKAAQEMQAISGQAQQARSTAQTSAIEAGVSGLSVDSLINDYTMKESQFLDNTQRQLRGTLFQLEQNKQGLRSQYQGQVLSMTPQPVASPSLLATGLTIGSNMAAFGSNVFFNTVDRKTLSEASVLR